MTVEYLSLPELLKLYRERRGLSQRQLAAQANFDPSLISKWENQLRTPSLANLEALASVLQLNESQVQNLIDALDGTVAESLALHEILSLYLDQTELSDAQIVGRLGERDRNKLRAWRRRRSIPTNEDLTAIIQAFQIDQVRASKLRSAKPRLDYSPELLGFILLGSGEVAANQVSELVDKGIEIVASSEL